MEKGRLDLEMGTEGLKEVVNVESLGKAVFAVAAAIVDERLVVRLFCSVCGEREWEEKCDCDSLLKFRFYLHYPFALLVLFILVKYKE